MSSRRPVFFLSVVVIAFVFSFYEAPGALAQSYDLSREIGSGIFGTLTAPNDVAIGSDGKVVIADTSNMRVLILDEYGNMLNDFGVSEQFLPTGVDLTDDGQSLLVSDLLGSIYNVSTIDFSFNKWGTVGSGPGEFNAPSGVAAGPDGNVYVADTDNNRVQKFSPDGTFLSSWDNTGLLAPQGVAVDDQNGIVLVSDTDNGRIQVFNPNGNLLLIAGTGQFAEPAGISFGPDSNVYIADISQGRAQKFGPDGMFLDEIGTGFLFSPHGIAVDQGGNVYIADTGNNRIAVFTPDIVVIDRGRGQRDVNRPAGVAVIVDIQPDSYWMGALAEIYAWVEIPSIGINAYYVGTDVWVPFNDFTEMAPVLDAIPVFQSTNNVPVLVNSTAGLPPASFSFNICLDRQLNGIYNPSASTCGRVDITLH